MQGNLCQTRGCWTKVKTYERWCLACRLDRGMEDGVPRSKGRPAGAVLRADGFSSRCVNRGHRGCRTCLCPCHQDQGQAA